MFVKSVNGQQADGFTSAPGDADPVLFACDVIAVAPNTTMHALYVVDNPSAWIVHCHIGKHLNWNRTGACGAEVGYVTLDRGGDVYGKRKASPHLISAPPPSSPAPTLPLPFL